MLCNISVFVQRLVALGHFGTRLVEMEGTFMEDPKPAMKGGTGVCKGVKAEEETQKGCTRA